MRVKDTKNGFFEAFARAVVNIPKSIPIVGGFKVGQVDLGISTEKVWGKMEVLFVDLGVAYYWGGDFDWGSGVTAKPTYPDLLGLEERPVYYDAENDRTLYMRVGTNISAAIAAEITDNPDEVPRLLGTASLYSDISKRNHRFNLGTRSEASPSDALIVVNYDANDLDHAINIAKAIIAAEIRDNNGNSYAITLYDGENVDKANGNVTYDPETSKGSFAFSMTDQIVYDKDWIFTTPVPAEIIMYNVDVMPEVTSVSGSITGNSVEVTWSGTQLGDLDSIKFFLVSDRGNTDESGYFLGELTGRSDIESGEKTFAIPGNIPTDSYYVRAVYTQNDTLNSVINSSNNIDIVNPKTPDQFTITSVKPAGDYKLGIEISNPSADAYIVNVYQYDAESNSWVLSDVNGVVVEKDNIKDNTLVVGGNYVFSGDDQKTAVKGLTSGVDYRIGVIACNFVNTDEDEEYETQVLSSEYFYSASGNVTDVGNATSVRVPVPAPPVVSVRADKTPVVVTRNDGNETLNIDTYLSNDITFTVTSDKDITGKWELDGAENLNDMPHDISGKAATIPLTGLTEGDHTLIIRGKGPNGDGFRQTYTFTVDTLAPRLLLSSPVNGSFFNEDGTLTVTGVTDADALFTVYCNGRAVCEKKSISELNGTIDSNGTFAFNIALPDAHSASSHKVVIYASDEVGNTSANFEAEVFHGGLSNISSLEIYVDGVKWDNSNITSNPLSSPTHKLSLGARTGNGITFCITDQNIVSWFCTAAEGTASIDSDGTLTIGAGSVGFVTGSLEVVDDGSISADITFGAEKYNSGYMVVTGSTPGGSVTGGGVYAPGDTVTLTAVPDSGYDFTGWTLYGVSVSNTSSPSISFTMPNNNVVATANFAYRPSEPGGTRDSGGTSGTGGTVKPQDTPGTEDTTGTSPSEHVVKADAGRKVTYRIPENADAKRMVPYYMVNGRKVYVPMSSVADGVLSFIAPVDGEYFLEIRDVSFTDTKNHWADDYITQAAARGLFVGIGDGKFEPDGDMKRAMFVTVLWRLAGQPEGGTVDFRDAVPGSYYSEALAWASNNGIVNGYGNDLFGVNDRITREQMCVIFIRFLKYLGYDFSGVTEAMPFADNDKISSWALEEVGICRRLGIVTGKPGNIFDPAADTTRAESCAMFMRLIDIILKREE